MHSIDLTIRQSERYVKQDWWEWEVWLDGSKENLDKVVSVEWRLHPSFPDPVRRITNRSDQFKLKSAGWGVFPVHAFVMMKDKEVRTLTHFLELHYPDGTATKA